MAPIKPATTPKTFCANYLFRKFQTSYKRVTYDLNRFTAFFSPLGKNMELLIFTGKVLEVVSAALCVGVAAKLGRCTGLSRG
jgi:hypothetical protein